MFDKVKSRTRIHIELGKFEQLKNEGTYIVDIKRNINADTGELTYSVSILNHSIPYIRYYFPSQTLVIEVSVPRYLFGDNVHMVKNASDIDLFFNKLHNDFKELLNISIDRNDWIAANRFDVSYNLDISKTGFLIDEWIIHTSQQSIPYKKNKTVHYENDDKLTGVTFKASATSHDKVHFYNKHAEVKQNKYYRDKEDILQRAEGMLRIEIVTSPYERDKYSSSKLLSDYLTKDFFVYIMQKYKINEILHKKFEQEIDEETFSYHWLKQHMKVYQIETMLGYIKIQNDLEELARSLYSKSTYDNRIREFNKFQKLLDQQRETKPIQIDFKNLA
ncbi:hypothetical protein ACFFHH_20210 [Cytobacillus solani]|uniref:hypothetical protein n=1 Tax=Cytobacillus solani TaxID=1637975 RepID=UPI001150F1F5|nr:hypothetical protein [Cytobacillus solani]